MKLMSSMNGVIKITKRSLMKFQFGDDGAIIILDVVEVSDQWHEINFALRILQNDMWILPIDKINEFAVNRLNFVQSIVNDAYTDGAAPILSRIEAEEFIKLVQKAADDLRNFISSKDDETSSVLESTDGDRKTDFSQ